MPELIPRLTPLAKPHVPELFKQIMRNHDEQQAIHDNMMFVGHAGAIESWCKLKVLRHEMREYRLGAEKALKWNTDKGKPA